MNFCTGTAKNINIEFNSKINYLNTETHNDLAPFHRGIMIGSDEYKLKEILPKRFSLALQNLKKYEDIRVMKADKGGSIVVMNSIEYRKKMYRLLEDETTYMKLDNPPTIKQLQTTFNQKVSKITEKLGEGSNTLKNKLTSSILPEYSYVYGAPKIHKPGCPLRPIVSSRKAPNKNLSI